MNDQGFVPYSTDERGVPHLMIDAYGRGKLLCLTPTSALDCIQQHGLDAPESKNELEEMLIPEEESLHERTIDQRDEAEEALDKIRELVCPKKEWNNVFGYVELVSDLEWKLTVLQSEVDVKSGKACAEEQTEGNGPCGSCQTCLRNKINKLTSLLHSFENLAHQIVNESKTTEEKWTNKLWLKREEAKKLLYE